MNDATHISALEPQVSGVPDITPAAERVTAIVIASTFTADLLQQPLRFWMERLEVAADVIVAPYAQLMQELLDPESLVSRNVHGYNILLVRPDDWIRDRWQESVERNVQHLRRAADDFATAVGRLRTGAGGSTLIFLCPPSPASPDAYREPFDAIRRELSTRLATLPRTYCCTDADVARLYPVVERDDLRAEKIGHIPYTHQYFVAIATLLARRIAVLSKPRCKVIAVDCDNTLWKGICGEDGAAGVQLTAGHIEFQRALVRQHDAGVLLCLCSKNNEADVEAVFQMHPEMPLREEHLVTSRVNWNPKSANLASLAEELGLGLDSFILIDDSDLECAEVGTNCPSVLALKFPEAEAEIAHFLNHMWAFDYAEATEEARGRTLQYKQNQARRKALERSADLAEFLASLELKVDVSPMDVAQLPRVAELVQRTNQFNLTGIRRRLAELESLWRSGSLRILVACVRDRFGDYGLVGTLFFRVERGLADVDTFVLSCRVLGRGVELRIINELASAVHKEGVQHIVLHYRRTSRNEPAWKFVEKSFSEFRQVPGSDSELGSSSLFMVPVEYAETVGDQMLAEEIDAEQAPTSNLRDPSKVATSVRWYETGYRLSRVADISSSMTKAVSNGPRGQGSYIAPRTPAEAEVAKIWAEVLGVSMVGIRDDFFDLGGDSLTAVQILASIGTILGVDVSIYEFFEGPTVEELSRKLEGADRLDAAIESVQGESRAPLSSAQQRLWFIDRLEGSSAAYHVPIGLRLLGELDRVALQSALDHLVERHESLRTSFVETDGEVMQEVAPNGFFALQAVDLRGRTEQQGDGELLEQLQSELAAPFDLSAGPLIRGRVLQLADDEHVLLITIHHIVSDMWSVGVLLRELSALYETLARRGVDLLSPLPIQYADYARWQRQWLTGTDSATQLDYWREHLSGAPEVLELPSDRPRPATQSYRGATVPVALNVELTERIMALSRRENLTLAMTLYAAWSVVLSRLSGQTDIVIGIPVANRRRTELQGLIGFLVNTLAIRVRLDDDPSVQTLLERVRNTMLEAYVNQDAPFEKVVEALQPERSLSHSPIFQVMLALQNAPRGAMEFCGLAVSSQEVPLHTSQFDLLLSLQESATGISGTLNYATDLFDASTVQRWVECFQSVLEGMVQSSDARISRLPLMSADESRRMVELLNATRAPYSESKLIHELFEEQVERTPAAPAVLYEEQSLTYAELNAWANRLARYLRDRGVGPDQLVGICVERSMEMVVGLLGILKAGGAYVPLDPSYPAERLEHMLRDAAPTVLLTQAQLRSTLPSTTAEVFALDADWHQIAERESGNLSREASDLSSRHLAYVIYTSGSTGKPKGAMNEHRALINRLQWMQNEYQLDSTKRVLQKTPFSFDVSVWEFFWTLMTGAQLIVARPRGHQDPDYLRRLIEQTAVTTLHFVPSMLQIFLDQLRPGQCPSVQHVVCSGEELPAHLQRKFFELLPQARLSNLYGPTEAAVDVTSWECQANDQSARVPIGRPISNTQIYVLDAHGSPVPIGVAGEIYIGGVGVGRGYLNRPELTDDRFVGDPFSPDRQMRLYKTGDVGRWRADGAVEYLGRNDHQVKIRGLRIELGEIEARLIDHKNVKEAVVIARQDAPGEKQLVAYVVPLGLADLEGAPSVEALRAHLRVALPEYMVPSAFVLLEQMPLSPNGKLDRRALPAPRLDAYTSRQYTPVIGEMEEILAGIWQGLLRVERVGRRDNFFELGGHSLLIVQMVERLRRVGISVEVRRVFENPTLSDLASVLENQATEQFAVPPNLIPPGCEIISPEMLPLAELEALHIERIVKCVPGGAANIQDIYPLAPLQEGILFHHLLNERGGDTYVLPIVLSVSSRQRLAQLIEALQAVVDRHDVLRTAVLWEDLPRPVQVICRRAVLPVKEVAWDAGQDPLEQVKHWIKPERQRMDIRCAPLLRLQIAAHADGAQHYVLLQLHHMIIDHVTLESITAEVVARLQDRVEVVPESAPYRDHVAQSLAYAGKRDAESFFTSKLADIDEPTTPFGLPDVHGDGSNIEEGRQDLELDLAQRIRAQARRLGVSAATLLHAAWALVVARTSGRDSVVFGTVLLGRMQGGLGAQRTLGMFINTLPLRLRLRGVTARELVEHTQRELIELLSHEQASLAVAQRCSGIVGPGPLFSALLNYRHSVPNPDAEWSSAEGVRLLAIQERTNYPLTLSVDDLTEGFILTVKSQRGVEPDRVIGYVRAALYALVDALERSRPCSALTLPILPDSERLQLTKLFNATHATYPKEKLIHQLYEEQVKRIPHEQAVIHGDQSLTYAELNAKANQLARHLRQVGLGPDQVVAICVERGFEMVVGLLGILKAGGAYLPLDPEYPTERLTYMLQDAAPRVLLTQARLRQRLPSASLEVIELDVDWERISRHASEDLDARALGLHSGHLAYVIYTSGSTGQPKGVMVEHGNVVSLWQGLEGIYHQSGPCRRVGVNASFNFDASVKQLVQMLSGRAIAMVPQEVRWDETSMLRFIKENSIDAIDCTPSQLRGWVSAGLFDSDGHKPRVVLVGGEPIDSDLWNRLARCSDIEFYNVYGPTESTVDATFARVHDDTARPHIGKPMENRQVYLLDSHAQPVPIGVVGELYIGGEGVARGYLRRPDLTRERFIPDQFSEDPSARWYKTGDLGRWRADGVIEYLGRNDQQVKIRGVRIELGEIEAQLVRHEGVAKAVVIGHEDATGEKRLVAYVVLDAHAISPENGIAEVLRSWLRKALPEHMVPGAFVVLPGLPLTPSGKIDRRALPAPELGASVRQEYEAPVGDVEEQLAQIWRELLAAERIGRGDNFFDLGGHSLLALRALVKINEHFGCALRVIDIYGSPTIRELAARLGSGGMVEDDLVDLSREATLPVEIVAGQGSRRAPAEAILLTGSTGFVGRFLLSQLLHDTDATIHCLVRGQSRHQAAVRLKEALCKWDLWRDEHEGRIVAVPGDLRQPRLGLADGDYATLCQEVDSIYHCATSMNHLETYAMAKRANVESVRDILRLATEQRPKVINYISTLSVFAPVADVMRVIDESSSIDHEMHRQTNGYMSSKWVAEKIFMKASDRGIPCNILRLGLVWADSRQGRYDELQRIYRILKSCLLSGLGIRNYRPDMAPTPVDYVARASVFLAQRYRDGQGVFHISSSHQAIDGMFERYNEIARTPLELLPYYEWICEMKRLHRQGRSMPAVPLIEFAFSMDEGSFNEWQRARRSAGVRFDLSRSHTELEQAGIVAPLLDDDLLRVCIDGMLARDTEVRAVLGCDSHLALAERGEELRLDGA